MASELAHPRIGASSILPGKAGVSFHGNTEVMLRANLWLRSAIRVLQLMYRVDLDPDRPAGETLYEAFESAADWTRLLRPKQSFSVDARIASNSNFRTSQLVTLRARDAICDVIRSKRGIKPSPPPENRCADLPLFVTVYKDRLSVYRDSSGHSLHRRGYRQAMHRASLNESAAAGCLYIAGWADLCGITERRNGSSSGEGEESASMDQSISAVGRRDGPTLVDPMMGSGTLLIEAALMATHTAPGIFRRRWPFFHWEDVDRKLWQTIVDEARAARRSKPALRIWGNDIHAGAVSLAARDAKEAGVRHFIRMNEADCKDWVLPRAPILVITNPPWGQRLLHRRDERATSDSFAQPNELRDSLMSLTSFLKQQAKGANAYVLSGSTQVSQYLRLQSSSKAPLCISGVDCRLLKYYIKPSD